MDVLFLEPIGKGIYYEQFTQAIKKASKSFFHYGPGTSYYCSSHTMNNILEIYFQENKKLPQLILFGFGWENDTYSENGYDSNIHGTNLGLSNIKIKKAFIINKEYKNLQQKLDFLKNNKFDAGFTVHHKFDEFSKIANTTFYQLPFAANREIFKDYKQEKTIDLGFSGNMFNYGIYKNTNIMGEYFQNIREKIFNELKQEKYKNLRLWWNSNSGNFLYGERYAKLINRSKIWLNTPSAIQIVGTRFYEVIACNTLLFCRESNEGIYNNLGFEDEKTCVMFKTDLSDFEEKLFYYLKNEEERNIIIGNAYQMFLERHTWEHRANFVLEKMKNI